MTDDPTHGPPGAHPGTTPPLCHLAMFIDHTTTRNDLEAAICSEADLYAQFDERRLLNNGYTTDELRSIVVNWIEAGDECAAYA
jgi:hypothetical protein